MKKIITEITFTAWEKGDRVVTPSGVGTVFRDSSIPKTFMEVICSTTDVQLDEGLSSNPMNKPLEIDTWLLLEAREIEEVMDSAND